jgi:hypothetical protein
VITVRLHCNVENLNGRSERPAFHTFDFSSLFVKVVRSRLGLGKSPLLALLVDSDATKVLFNYRCKPFKGTFMSLL